MTDKPKRDLDERVAIPLDPEEAIRALLKVDPGSEPVPALDLYVSEGPGSRKWRISCRTCGWNIEGQGKRPATADEAARTHRCP